METALPDILGYAEYRAYLRDRYRVLKTRDKRFSHRYINAKAGIHSSGWFADVLAGRQRLKSGQVSKVAATFKLNNREQEFLKVLVEFEQAATPEAGALALEKWLSLKGIPQETVARDRFRFYDRWYYPVLREVLSLKPFQGDYAALGACVSPPISPQQAREAVRLLERLGVLPPEGARTRRALPVLVKDSASRTRHFHRILKSLIKLSAPALERFGKEERNFSALVLGLSPEGLRQAGEEIALLRKRLLALSEKDAGKDRVYQCLFQVFPVSNPLEVSRD